MASPMPARAADRPRTATSDAIVEVRDICKRYDDVEALRNINLDF